MGGSHEHLGFPGQVAREPGGEGTEGPALVGTGAGACSEVGEELGDWLTKDEWNVCYFLGKEAFFRGEVQCTLCGQVAVGVRKLLQAGYRFQRLRVAQSGTLQPAPNALASGAHRSSCREVGVGTFDDMGRTREAVRWIQVHVPQIGVTWLQNLVALYDSVHTEP